MCRKGVVVSIIEKNTRKLTITYLFMINRNDYINLKHKILKCKMEILFKIE